MNQSTPLADHVRFCSTDLDESRKYVGGVFCAHKIHVVGSALDFSTQLREASFKHSSLAFTTYGAQVAIETSLLDTHFLVQVPWSGEIEVASGGHRAVFSPGTASVVSAANDMNMRWSRGSSFYTVKLCRKAVETKLSNLLGRELGPPLIFDPILDFSSPAGKRWCSAVDFVRQQIEQPLASWMREPLEAQLEDTLVLMLIELLPHNYTQQLHNTARAVAPKTVRRACEHVLENIQHNLTLDDLAIATAVSPATLSKHFRHYLGTSPLQYVRAKKLEAVHNELMAAGSETSVAEIALRYGFNHLGRFSAYYRDQYGRGPSATLKNG